MKTLEQLSLDNEPFYPDASTDGAKMRFMFLLEDGRLIGHEGQNHINLLGWTEADGFETGKLEMKWCAEYNALRLCYQPFYEKRDGTRGDFWSLYVEVGSVTPCDAQWDTLTKLYLLNGYRDTVVTWDVQLADGKWSREHEGTLAGLRAVFKQKAKL